MLACEKLGIRPSGGDGKFISLTLCLSLTCVLSLSNSLKVGVSGLLVET